MSAEELKEYFRKQEEKNKALLFLVKITEKVNRVGVQKGGGISKDKICRLIYELREEVRVQNKFKKIIYIQL